MTKIHAVQPLTGTAMAYRNRLGLTSAQALARAPAARDAAPASRPTRLKWPAALPAREESERLWDDEHAARASFDAIVPVLKEIAALQHETDFVAQAQALARQRLGFSLPAPLLEDAWVDALDMRRLYAHAVFQTFRHLNQTTLAGLAAERGRAAELQRFFLECGYHLVAVSHCADGRLKGLVRYILRLPLTAVQREASAGTLFDVEESLRHWSQTELSRYRAGLPNAADASTQYLKIAVYHFSSSDPHQGCAAHGNDTRAAAQAALDRLTAFRDAIENSYCCGASVATLLIGVDTDTDAIKLHVPDGAGDLSLYRLVDNGEMRARTPSAADARELIETALEQAIGTESGWGRGQGRPSEGMRRLLAYLLENNLRQIEYVHRYHGGRYAEIGHHEHFISAGNGYSDEQLRNLAYYARLDTVEEGAADFDVGIKIFSKLNVAHGLPVPVIIHRGYDARVPGSRERASAQALRLGEAVRQRYSALAGQRLLCIALALQNLSGDGRCEFIDADGFDLDSGSRTEQGGKP